MPDDFHWWEMLPWAEDSWTAEELAAMDKLARERPAMCELVCKRMQAAAEEVARKFFNDEL
jgi:hypothetical protein